VSRVDNTEDILSIMCTHVRGPEKMAQSLMHRDFATVCSTLESRSFQQNAQKLTGNTNNGNFEYCD